MTYIHLIAAATWLGSMIFFVTILVPYFKKKYSREEYVDLLNEVGKLWRVLGWICLITIAITGAILSDIISGWQAFASADGHSEKPASTIAWKMLGGAVIFIFAAIHDFKLGPKAIVAWKEDPDSNHANKLRSRLTMYGRINLILSLIIFWLGITILRGS